RVWRATRQTFPATGEVPRSAEKLFQRPETFLARLRSSAGDLKSFSAGCETFRTAVKLFQPSEKFHARLEKLSTAWRTPPSNRENLLREGKVLQAAARFFSLHGGSPTRPARAFQPSGSFPRGRKDSFSQHESLPAKWVAKNTRRDVPSPPTSTFAGLQRRDVSGGRCRCQLQCRTGARRPPSLILPGGVSR